jgi:hypothetical protein
MLGGLGWISACPKDYQVAVEIARQRSIAEALVPQQLQQQDHLHDAV